MSKALEPPKLSKKISLKRSGAVRKKKLFPETILHKICETDASFHVNGALRGSLNAVFQEVFASINKAFILAGGLGVKTLLSLTSFSNS